MTDEVRPGETPVIVCLWRRPERLERILELLDNQQGAGRLRLFLWNNDRNQARRYADVLGRRVGGGALAGVQLLSSNVNIGGAARFLVARSIAGGGYAGPVVMLDDDQDVAEEFVASLLDGWCPGTYGGVWAWRIHGDYWDRSFVRDGGSATYVGTGGSIADADLLGSDEVTAALPRRRLFLEDMWLSAVAIRSGRRAIGITAPFTFTDLSGNQWHAIADEKSAFFDELGRPGLLPRDKQ